MSATSLDVDDIFKLDSFGLVHGASAFVSKGPEKALSPAIAITLITECKRVRLATGNLRYAAHSFHKSWHVATLNVCAANAQFAVLVGAHRIHVRAFLRRAHENGVIFAAAHLSNQNVETAHFRHWVLNSVLAHAKLPIVVVCAW